MLRSLSLWHEAKPVATTDSPKVIFSKLLTRTNEMFKK